MTEKYDASSAAIVNAPHTLVEQLKLLGIARRRSYLLERCRRVQLAHAPNVRRRIEGPVHRPRLPPLDVDRASDPICRVTVEHRLDPLQRTGNKEHPAAVLRPDMNAIRGQVPGRNGVERVLAQVARRNTVKLLNRSPRP